MVGRLVVWHASYLINMIKFALQVVHQSIILGEKKKKKKKKKKIFTLTCSQLIVRDISFQALKSMQCM